MHALIYMDYSLLVLARKIKYNKVESALLVLVRKIKDNKVESASVSAKNRNR